MKIYRRVWSLVVLLAGLVAGVAGWVGFGWLPELLTVGSLAVLGAVFALALAPPERRWRTVGRTTGWCVAGGILLLGLPVLVGPWSMLLLVTLAVSAPDLVALALGAVRARRPVGARSRPERYGDQDLRRRWRRTCVEIHEPRRTPEEILRLVEERAVLLDELERRDGEWFADWLARSGWRTTQDS